MIYKAINRIFIGALLIVGFPSCQPADDGTHLHDAQGGHIVADPEIPTSDATIWTNSIELFVEYPVLIVGNTSRFAAHCTLLANHKPIENGTVTVSLIKDGKGIRHSVEAPSSPGIFRPSLQPMEAGIYDLVFDIKTDSIDDKIVIEKVRVFETLEEAMDAQSNVPDNGGSITFLKEQAWKMEFKTVRVSQGEIHEVISTSGVWRISPSDYQTLVAGTNGTVSFKNMNLTEGRRVKKGQVLMTISSDLLTTDNLKAEIQKAKANFDQTKSAYERKKQLHDSKIVPKAELEKYEKEYQVSKLNYETLSLGYSLEGKQVIVPFDGYIKSLSVSNGAFVEQGDFIVMITSHQSSLLETHVSPSYSSQLNKIHDLWYQPKPGYWSSLNNTGGNILSVGREVESNKPLLSVFAEINDVVEMPEGSFTEVHLALGDPVQTTLIPESALLEDYGKYTVIVELSGESFERRSVTIGRKNGAQVEIKDGLLVGEYVVSKGAYQVKMASMSGQVPAHGHDH